MTKQESCKYLEEVVVIAADAGRRILEVYERSYAVSDKLDGSPLTEADSLAHTLIVERLGRMSPDIPILSEESAAVDYAERSHWHTFWLVDPLDGTKEFINHNGEFTVNIALIVEGRPVLGVVYVPVTGTTYLACIGIGAFKQVGRTRQVIHASRYSGGKATVVASRSHRGDKLEGFLARLEAHEGGYETASMGSSLKLCLVAESKADVYPRLGPTSEWDTAAAQCVVEVAGGHVTDMRGKPLIYNKPSVLNPWFLVSGAGKYDWSGYVEGLG
jgi:3'(2'), 5'-bisphosphate nucleotidase